MAEGRGSRGGTAPQAALAGPWLWLFPAVYGVHLLDERLTGIGTAEFATRYLGMYFTDTAWLWVNAPSLVAVGIATALVVRGSWPAWVVVSLATHVLLHGIGRLPTSLWFGLLQPGLVTGVLLCLPLGAFALLRGVRTLSPRELRTGVLVGVASFQPLWHFVLLPVLPRGPGAG